MGEQKIKGCPWCGAQADVWGEQTTQIGPDGNEHIKETEWFIQCNHHIACMGGWIFPREMPRFTSRERAIEAWNDRDGDKMFIVTAATIVSIAKKGQPKNLQAEHKGKDEYNEGWSNACDYIASCIGALAEGQTNDD